jgi:NAD-dependent dihydropyrimidine dehydrogenase PreA subunit
MTIARIDAKLCTGCGLCVNACWMDVIRMDKKSGKAKIKYPDDCATCNSCELECPVHAIRVSPAVRLYEVTTIGL